MARVATSLASDTGFEENRTRIPPVGCDDFMRKPFPDAYVLDAMEKHLVVQYTYRNYRLHPAAPAPEKRASDARVLKSPADLPEDSV